MKAAVWIFVSSIIAASGACGGDGGGGDGGDCCEITFNGVSDTLACGEAGCVNGRQFMCGADAEIIEQGSCTGGGGGELPAICLPPQEITEAELEECRSGGCIGTNFSAGFSYCSPPCTSDAECDDATGEFGAYSCSGDDFISGTCLPACEDDGDCVAPFDTCFQSNTGGRCG